MVANQWVRGVVAGRCMVWLGCLGWMVWATGTRLSAEDGAPVTAPGEWAVAEPELSTTQQKLLNEVSDEMLSVWDIDGPAATWDAWRLGDDDGGNAAENFHRLADLYPLEKEEGKATVPSSAKGVQELIQAARRTRCQMHPDFYPAPVSGDSPQPDYVVLVAYGIALLNHAAERAGTDTQAADEAYRAGLLCGRHLMHDASSLLVYMAGLSIQRRSAMAYQKFLRERLRTEDVIRINEHLRRLEMLHRRVRYKSTVVLGDMMRFNSLPAMMKIARRDQQRLWRQEAVIRLGVFRWGAPKGEMDDQDRQVMEHDADWQSTASATLQWVERHDPDPSMRALAVWAFQQLTPDRFAEMRMNAMVVRSTTGTPTTESTPSTSPPPTEGEGAPSAGPAASTPEAASSAPPAEPETKDTPSTPASPPTVEGAPPMTPPTSSGEGVPPSPATPTMEGAPSIPATPKVESAPSSPTEGDENIPPPATIPPGNTAENESSSPRSPAPDAISAPLAEPSSMSTPAPVWTPIPGSVPSSAPVPGATTAPPPSTPGPAAPSPSDAVPPLSLNETVNAAAALPVASPPVAPGGATGQPSASVSTHLPSIPPPPEP